MRHPRVAQPRSQGLFLEKCPWERGCERLKLLFLHAAELRQVLFNLFASSNVSHKQDNFFVVMQIKL